MSDARGTAYQARLSTLISLFGEALTLVRGGVDNATVAIVDPANTAITGTFYDANEAVGLLKPSLTLYVGSAGYTPQADDVFFRDSRLYTVRKLFFYRIVDVIVFTLVHCD